MVKKTYSKKSDQKTVKQELEDTSPIVVRFYKATCPACIRSAPAWDQFDMPGYRVIAVEEQAIPPDVLMGISAFPTYAKHDQKGSSHTVGAITDPNAIMSKLA
jgi:hypothetical protein